MSKGSGAEGGGKNDDGKVRRRQFRAGVAGVILLINISSSLVCTVEGASHIILQHSCRYVCVCVCVRVCPCIFLCVYFSGEACGVGRGLIFATTNAAAVSSSTIRGGSEIFGGLRNESHVMCNKSVGTVYIYMYICELFGKKMSENMSEGVGGDEDGDNSFVTISILSSTFRYIFIIYVYVCT